MHIELIGYNATAPGAAPGAAAAVIPNIAPGASLTIKNSKSKCALLEWWGFNQGAGYHQNVFQSGHDTTRNIRVLVNAAEVDQRLPSGNPLMVEPQEQMQITIVGSAVAGDVEQGCFLALYKDLPGVNARLISWGELQSKKECTTTIEATLTGAATGVTGIEAITAESDLLKANRDYAVLGCTVSLDCLAALMQGPDFGNVYIGVPGDASDNDNTCDYFTLLARRFGAPLIPVFNSGNKGSMNFAFVQNENNINPRVTWYLALLK